MVFLLAYGSPAVLTLAWGVRFHLWSRHPEGWPAAGQERISDAVIKNYDHLPLELMLYGALAAVAFALMAREFPTASTFWVVSALSAAAALFGFHLRRAAAGR